MKHVRLVTLRKPEVASTEAILQIVAAVLTALAGLLTALAPLLNKGGS
ncbi:MAG: hypothetical protein N3G21_07550 [Candidatus Hydrogenedentes bacterium]|nr:hypothetical protein [Candidatus Hydrogenedentota bacterium]